MKTIDEILKRYKVKTYKDTGDGYIAIRKGGKWLWFAFNNGEYYQSGSTDKLC